MTGSLKLRVIRELQLTQDVRGGNDKKIKKRIKQLDVSIHGMTGAKNRMDKPVSASALVGQLIRTRRRLTIGGDFGEHIEALTDALKRLGFF